MLNAIIENLKLRKNLTAAQYRAVYGLRAGQVAIDCGANIGMIARALASHGATVYAFEPNPYAFAELKKRSANFNSIKPVAAAVSTAPGTARLYLHRDADKGQVEHSQGSSMIATKTNVNPDTFVDAVAVDLADFILNLPTPVDVVKMDIEGFEVEVVPHLITSGAIDRIGVCYVETHERKAPDLLARTDAMRALINARGLQHKFVLDWH